MLILAGVSLNAIVGDNGIITNAQTANMKSGMVALEEWLQQKYVEYYDETEEYPSKPELLNSKIRNLLLKDGSRDYIINEGKVYYLINKLSLPKEIKDQLIGGDTTEYSKYIRLQDVYGITEDLKVYYLDNEGMNTYGEMVVSDIDPNTPTIRINSDSEMKAAITSALSDIGIAVDSNSGVTIGNIEALNTLELDGTKYNITSLAGLGEIKGLKAITLKNLNLSNLDGLESLTDLYYLYLKNCTIGDYSKLENNWNLQYLYLYIPSTMSQIDANTQVTNLGSGLHDADKLTKLEYLGISGEVRFFENTDTDFVLAFGRYTRDYNFGLSKLGYTSTARSKLSDASGLGLVNQTIKNNVKYLYLPCNNLTSISSLADFNSIEELDVQCNSSLKNLEGLKNHSTIKELAAHSCDFETIKDLEGTTGLNVLTLQDNTKLSSLAGLEKSGNLKLLLAFNCDITSVTSLNGNTKLEYIDLSYNTNLVHIASLGTCTKINNLWMTSNEAMDGEEVKDSFANETTHIVVNCGKNYDFPEKYMDYFRAISNSLDYSVAGIHKYLLDSDTMFTNLKDRKNVTRLSLNGQKNLTDVGLQNILKTMTGLEYVSLKDTGLKSLSFIKTVPNIIELDLRGCKFTVDNSTGKANLADLNSSCSKMLSFIIDDGNIDLTLIQTAINRISQNVFGTHGQDALPDSFINKNASDCRGFITSGSATFNYGSCTQITHLFRRNYIADLRCTAGTLIDLSNCNLNNVWIWYSECDLKAANCSTHISFCLGNFIPVNEGYYEKLTLLASNASSTLHPINNLANYLSESCKITVNKLDLQRFKLTDISFLDYITFSGDTRQLRFSGDGYGLNGSSISEINFGTKQFTAIANLDYYYGDTTDLSFLKAFPNLLRFNCYACRDLTSLNGIQNCPSLIEIVVNTTIVNDISSIANLTNLTRLELYNNKINNISALSDLKNVSTLNLKQNSISDLSPLLGMRGTDGKVKFTELDISSCSLVATTSSGVDNIDIIRTLHSAGLKKLTITGNTAITDTSKPECQVYISDLQAIFNQTGDLLTYR